jgi:hypothetical protein
MNEYINKNFTRTPQGVVLANKNPHAVALGKMTSPAKAAASKRNGAKAGKK